VTTAVVDASAIAAMLFEEPQGPAIEMTLRGLNLVAPRLLRFEIANVAARKRRRDPATADMIDRAMRRYRALRIREMDLPEMLIYETAMVSGLTGYYAAYLALARVVSAPLVTLDAAVAAAAAR
jgi:predicted nucleic acid-binding protein